ncbi:helix-turn-helix domain-containing protein [Dactylosporangium sp. NPDC005572]|uniref:helix-turn-helix domain-containing protein n=1 Tax=Dactylosporangium sp. NPDC005572 TaxID=3156889 RepID=UPI0033AE24EE
MSVLASSWVWRHAQAGGTALIVLLAIADHADDDGVGFPSIPTLAAKARLDERTIQRIIRRLVGAGQLRILDGTAGGRRSNTYQLVMDRTEAISTPPADCHPGDSPPVAESGHPSPGEIATPAPAESCRPNIIQPSSNRRGAALPPTVGTERCPEHVGQLASNCGACRSLVLAGGLL